MHEIPYMHSKAFYAPYALVSVAALTRWSIQLIKPHI
jgi:hypothetical protein